MQTRIYPETREELAVYWTIVCTWGLWLLGALYLVAPVLGWWLIGRAAWQWSGSADSGKHSTSASLAMCILWTVAMLAMLLALVVGHADFSLSIAQTIKSIIGWGKGWALLAIFICGGALLNIRPSVIFRASNILALQTLIFVPIFVLAAVLGLPKSLYVSPLYMLGGPSAEFFNVELYRFDAGSGLPRWRFFAPWAPAAGFVAVISAIFAWYDKSIFWKGIGLASAIFVCLMSQSRLAIVSLPLVAMLVGFLFNLYRPATWAFAAVSVLVALTFSNMLVDGYQAITDLFVKSRADSSYVRATLQSIALHRWITEAPVWGHGIVERGPHLVQYMPIGSHHTWYGLLYVKGAVGFLALAIPLIVTAGILLIKSQLDRVARAALSVLLVIFFYTFGENLEILIYLIWPGLLVIGIALKRRIILPTTFLPNGPWTQGQ